MSNYGEELLLESHVEACNRACKETGLSVMLDASYRIDLSFKICLGKTTCCTSCKTVVGDISNSGDILMSVDFGAAEKSSEEK